jgi:hypothetical protein
MNTLARASLSGARTPAAWSSRPAAGDPGPGGPAGGGPAGDDTVTGTARS